jgi:N-acylneuraminate cytidylyltransferase
MLADYSISTIAMIPARISSTRLKMIKLALIKGRLMISYAVRAAIESGTFDRVVVNADHPLFEGIASVYGAELYSHPQSLARQPQNPMTLWLC